jgi:two-component system chemotaxis response regulator CheB
VSSTAPLVAIGASAGGVQAIGELLSQLPADLAAPVLVVVHTAPVENQLASVFARHSRLPVVQAVDGQELAAGTVYLAAPDHHLLVDDGHARVVRGPHENGHRPAIDPLFRSAALARRGGVVAVVLTGALDDGAAGAQAVTKLGGHVLVQDPDEAPYPSMPLNAIAADHPEAVLPLARLPAAIAAAVAAPAEPSADPVEEQLEREQEYAELGIDVITDPQVFPELSPFACPSCGGALWEAPEEGLRFRCRIGHAFGSETLLLEQSEQLDQALAEALRALQERSDLARRVARRLRLQGLPSRAERYERIVADSERHGLAIRNVLLHRDADGHGSPEP